MIYDLSQRPRTVSLGSLVVERTSGTRHTAYRPTIGGYSTYHYEDTYSNCDDTIEMTIQ